MFNKTLWLSCLFLLLFSNVQDVFAITPGGSGTYTCVGGGTLSCGSVASPNTLGVWGSQCSSQCALHYTIGSGGITSCGMGLVPSGTYANDPGCNIVQYGTTTNQLAFPVANICNAGTTSLAKVPVPDSKGAPCLIPVGANFATVTVCASGYPMGFPTTPGVDSMGCPSQVSAPVQCYASGGGQQAYCNYTMTETGVAPAVSSAVVAASNVSSTNQQNASAVSNATAAAASAAAGAGTSASNVAGSACVGLSGPALTACATAVGNVIANGVGGAGGAGGTGGTGGNGSGGCDLFPNTLGCADNGQTGPWNSSSGLSSTDTMTDASSGMSGYISSSVSALSGVGFSTGSSVFNVSINPSWWSPGNSADASLTCGQIYGTSDNLPPTVTDPAGFVHRLPDICNSYGPINFALMRSWMDVLVTFLTVIFVFYTVFEGE